MISDFIEALVLGAAWNVLSRRDLAIVAYAAAGKLVLGDQFPPMIRQRLFSTGN